MVDFLQPIKYNIIKAGTKETRWFVIAKKMGRPKAEKPKDIQYSIRVDTELETQLEKYCEKNNITKGQAFRKGINLLLNGDSKKETSTGGKIVCPK